MGLFDIRFAWIQGVARKSKQHLAPALFLDPTAELARKSQAREKRVRVEEVKE